MGGTAVKRTVTVLAVAVIAAGLAACGGGWDADEIAGYEAPPERTVADEDAGRVTPPERAEAGQDADEAGQDAEAEREPDAADREQRPGEPEPGGVPGRLLDACRGLAEDAPGLSDRARERLIRECEGAATGDEETMRRATEAVCVAAAFATMPGPARGPAADACKRLIR